MTFTKVVKIYFWFYHRSSKHTKMHYFLSTSSDYNIPLVFLTVAAYIKSFKNHFIIIWKKHVVLIEGLIHFYKLSIRPL